MPLAASYMPSAFFLLGALLGAQAQHPTKTADWRVLRPLAVSSRAGATLRIGEDQSILVTGPLVEQDIHTVEFETRLAGITGFRLEALPHPDLPKQGPGRKHNGHFQLCELGVEHAPKGRDRGLVSVAFVDAATQGTGRAYHAVDGNRMSAWGSGGRPGRPHAASFAIAGPIGDARGTRLRIRLAYVRGGQQIGRFRLSATTDPRPLRGLQAPLGAAWGKTQLRINDAIDRGVDALLVQQELDGSWREHAARYPSGQTALALYTLLHCGVPKNDPAVVRALAFLRAHPPKRTYSAACQILALCTLKDPSHRPWIQGIVDELVSWQRGNGYGYPDGNPDLSNTHYAALALYVAAVAGHQVPARVWERFAKVAVRHQQSVEGGPVTGGERPAGFRYRVDGQATGSMTVAGITILGAVEKRLRRKRPDIRRAKNRGLAWLIQHFSATANPSPRSKEGHQNGRLHYYLYGMERVGAILELTHLGPHDWYRKGALHLVDTQAKDGRWERSQHKTCFALLFLTKATSRASLTGRTVARGKRIWGTVDANAPFSVRIAGDSPHGMWVQAWGRDTLDRLGHGEGKSRHLRVRKVEYWAAPAHQRDHRRLIATVAGDPARPARDQRFAAQYGFTVRGNHVVLAKAFVEKPDGAQVIVESRPVEILVARVRDDALLSYAADAAKNRLAGVRITAHASSERGGWTAAQAGDNLQATGWRSDDDDPIPWLAFELARPVKANTILLSHAHDPLAPDRQRTGRIERVALQINGRKQIFEIDMVPDDWKKTVFELPRAFKVKQLLLRVVSVRASATAQRGVGFAEVELQLR